LAFRLFRPGAGGTWAGVGAFRRLAALFADCGSRSGAAARVPGLRLAFRRPRLAFWGRAAVLTEIPRSAEENPSRNAWFVSGERGISV
jgi:hypothetical protein